MKESTIEKSPLRCLFWKEEILQVLYWMKGEGMGTAVNPSQILPFLNSGADNLNFHLQKLHAEGFLKLHSGSGYSLTTIGSQEGGKHFAEAFQGMQKAGHGECGPDCEFCYGPDGDKLDNCVHNCAS